MRSSSPSSAAKVSPTVLMIDTGSGSFAMRAASTRIAVRSSRDSEPGRAPRRRARLVSDMKQVDCVYRFILAEGRDRTGDVMTNDAQDPRVRSETRYWLDCTVCGP